MTKSTHFLLGELSAQTDEIINVLNNETDIGAVLIATSFLDACLTTLLGNVLKKGKTTNKILEPRGILGTFSGKCDIAYCLNLIPKDLYTELNTIGKIRNKFAHNHLNTEFTNDQIEPLCQELRLPEQFLEDHKDSSNIRDLERLIQLPNHRFATSIAQLSNLLISKGIGVQWHGYEKSRV